MFYRIASWRIVSVIGGVALAVCPAAAQCPDLPAGTASVGHILTVEGKWRLRTRPAADLLPGCQLAPGSIIDPPARFAFGTAKIAIVEGSAGLRVQSCNANQDCSPPIILPREAQPNPGIFSSIIEEVMRKLRGAPNKYVATLAMDSGELNDAIVQQASGRIDLSPAMKGLGAADYELRFTRLLSVHWDGAGGSIDASSLGGGLYQVSRNKPDSTEAWVLVLPAGPAADDALRRDAQLRSTMNGWSPGADGPDTQQRDAKRTLYRAFLATEADRANARNH